MPRKSGAQYKKDKKAELRSESASRPGQLKISNIFRENFTDDNSNEGRDKGPSIIGRANKQCESSCVIDDTDGMFICLKNDRVS